jgi:hypothetical protein
VRQEDRQCGDPSNTGERTNFVHSVTITGAQATRLAVSQN